MLAMHSDMAGFDAAVALARALATNEDLDPALEALCARLDVHAATLVLGETAPDSVHWTSGVAPMVQAYFSDWVGRDPREARVQPSCRAGFAVDHDYFSPEEIAREPYYQEFLRPHGLAWAASAALTDEPAPMVLSLKLEAGREPFTHEHVLRCDHALPMLRRGAAFASAAWRAALLGQLRLLDQQHCGAVVLDRQARVRECNPSAQADMGVRIVDGSLRAHFPGEARALAGCIAGVLADRSPLPAMRRTLVHAAGDGRPVLVECASLRALQPGLAGAGAIIVLLRALAAPRNAGADSRREDGRREECVRTLFGLTPTEATLCLLLAEGRPMGECAALAGITLDHARQRAKRIYAKTGARGHAALAAMVARL